MSNFKFKPEDFGFGTYTTEVIADKANALLQAHLASLAKLYGIQRHGDWKFSEDPAFNPTHTAIVWSIAEFENKECEHEPDLGTFTKSWGYLNGTCSKCGVKLKATWEKA